MTSDFRIRRSTLQNIKISTNIDQDDKGSVVD